QLMASGTDGLPEIDNVRCRGGYVIIKLEHVGSRPVVLQRPYSDFHFFTRFRLFPGTMVSTQGMLLTLGHAVQVGHPGRMNRITLDIVVALINRLAPHLSHLRH